jgi:hypothetical protein
MHQPTAAAYNSPYPEINRRSIRLSNAPPPSVADAIDLPGAELSPFARSPPSRHRVVRHDSRADPGRPWWARPGSAAEE